jgi:hypothetical protein
MKTFSTQKKAEQWARAFDYARSLLNPPLPPLTVEPHGDDWIVVEPKSKVE